MNGTNLTVTFEVGIIEGEHTFDTVDAHDRYQPGIVDLDTLYTVVFHDLLPGRIDGRYVRQECQQGLDTGDFLEHFVVRKTKPINPGGARGDVPKLGDILGTEEDGVLPP